MAQPACEIAPLTDSDEGLLLHYARGDDTRALALLVERHWAFAYRVALRALGHQDAAEDTAQQTFCSLIRGASRFKPGRSFGPWFRTLLMNEVRMAVRSRRTRARHESRFAASRTGPSAAKDGAQRLLEQEVALRVSELPPELRLPLVLHFYEGCTHEEVGVALGRPTGTASSRIRRGLEKLRESLGAHGIALGLTGLESALRGAGQASSVVSPPTPTVHRLQRELRRVLLVSRLAASLPVVLALGFVGGATTHALVSEPAKVATQPVTLALSAPEPVSPGPRSHLAPETAPETTTEQHRQPEKQPSTTPAKEREQDEDDDEDDDEKKKKGYLSGQLQGPEKAVSFTKIHVIPGEQEHVYAKDGRFDAWLPAGEYELVASEDGLVTLPQHVSITAGGRTETTLTFMEGASLSGVVTGIEKRVLDSIKIAPLTDNPETVRTVGALTAPIEKDGHFRKTGLLPGRYRVSIPWAHEGEVVDLAIGREATVNFALASGSGKVIVHVRGNYEHRWPMSHAFAYRGQLGWSGSAPEILSNALGGPNDALLTDVAPGPLGVAFAVDSFVMFRENLVLKEGSPLDVELSWPDPATSGTLEGRVTGEGLKDLSVALRGDGLLAHADLKLNEDEDEGTFHMEGIPAGSYTVVVTNTSRTSTDQPSAGTPVTIEAGRTTANLTLRAP